MSSAFLLGAAGPTIGTSVGAYTLPAALGSSAGLFGAGVPLRLPKRLVR